jgi:hypothetical protein
MASSIADSLDGELSGRHEVSTVGKGAGREASGGVPTIQSAHLDQKGGHGARAPLPTLRVTVLQAGRLLQDSYRLAFTS